MFVVNEQYEIRQPVSQFFAAQLITQEWAEPQDAVHLLYLASSDVKDSQGHVLVTAYALHRPDDQWALMLINKDHDHPHPVHIVFHNADSNRDQSFTGETTMITFGKQQYQWHPARKKGHADPHGSPRISTVAGEENTKYELRPASLTVIRGWL